jgi:hypothetical protein
MLNLSSEQLAALEEPSRQRYCGDVRTTLRKDFPHLVAQFSDAVLLERIAVSTRWALEYGVRTGEGLLAYIALSLVAGPSFNGDPKIRQYFEFPGNEPDVKVEHLFKQVTEKLQGYQTISGVGAILPPPR